ncbi:MAG: SufD family Fe-S cluster assembly protein [Campylobacterales bacterium]
MMAPVTLDLITPEPHNPLFQRFEALGLPGNKTEQYRHFAIKPLLGRSYTLRRVAEHAPETGARLVLENGAVTEIPQGCSVTYVSPFAADTGHYDALYFLSHLMAPVVICLEITADTFLEIRHIVNETQTLLPYRLCISVLPGIRAEVFETFETDGSDESLLLYGIDAEVQAHATLRWIRDEYGTASEAALVGTHRFDVGFNGALELKTFDFGSVQALHLYKIDLDEYGWCDANHLLMASGESRRGNVVRINHNKPYAKCAQDARTILKDRATGIFDGLVNVGEAAHYASAHQNSKAVLLDANAYMYAKPQLEIYTDELEASHGATIGQLDESALFYLRSRGIAEDEARKMLVLAFADVLIDGVGEGELAERIHADFETAYFDE